MNEQEEGSQPPAWELREPTEDLPDVGLNWLVRNTSALRRRDGQPNVKAIGRVIGVSYSAMNGIIPSRRGQRDHRPPNERTIGRLCFVGAHVNGVPPEVAHSILFQLEVPPHAAADLVARLAELDPQPAESPVAA